MIRLIMKTIRLTITVVSLLVGLSGCLYPGRGWGGDWRHNGYEQGGQGSYPARDCFNRDGRRYCRDGS